MSWGISWSGSRNHYHALVMGEGMMYLKYDEIFGEYELRFHPHLPSEFSTRAIYNPENKISSPKFTFISRLGRISSVASKAKDLRESTGLTEQMKKALDDLVEWAEDKALLSLA